MSNNQNNFNNNLNISSTAKKLPPINSRQIIIDTETTGLFYQGHHIIELAAVEMKNGFLTGKQFHGYIKPRKRINWAAQKTHKMNDGFYREYIEGTFESDLIILKEFLDFVGDSIIIAHNASFDAKFLNHELRYWNLPEINEKRFRCSMRIFKNLADRNFFGKEAKGKSLKECCKFFNIKFKDESLHSAIYDAQLAGRLIKNIYDFFRNNYDNINRTFSNNEEEINVENLNNNNNFSEEIDMDYLFNYFEMIENNKKESKENKEKNPKTPNRVKSNAKSNKKSNLIKTKSSQKFYNDPFQPTTAKKKIEYVVISDEESDKENQEKNFEENKVNHYDIFCGEEPKNQNLLKKKNSNKSDFSEENLKLEKRRSSRLSKISSVSSKIGYDNENNNNIDFNLSLEEDMECQININNKN